MLWTNTNKLLRNGFSGLKTGITKSAWACLSAIWSPDEDYEYDNTLVIIVLNSKSADDRFVDT